MNLWAKIYFHCLFFFQAEDGIRYTSVTGVQTCALPISLAVLLQDLDVPTILVGIADPFAFLKSAVAGIALDEDDLLRGAKPGHAQDRVFDIARSEERRVGKEGRWGR